MVLKESGQRLKPMSSMWRGEQRNHGGCHDTFRARLARGCIFGKAQIWRASQWQELARQANCDWQYMGLWCETNLWSFCVPNAGPSPILVCTLTHTDVIKPGQTIIPHLLLAPLWISHVTRSQVYYFVHCLISIHWIAIRILFYFCILFYFFRQNSLNKLHEMWETFG